MNTQRFIVLALAVLLAALGAASRAWSDPPDRVGRLDLITGTVSFHPASVEDWTAATLNYPLTTGDSLWTDQDGEAEIHVGSTAIRLASNTEFAFLNLDDQTMQIRLSTGSLNLRLRHLEPEEVVEIDTPNSSLSLTRPGSYRVDVLETGDTTLTVRSGEAEVTAGDAGLYVYPDQAVEVSGLDSPSYQVSAAYPPDEWDQWCASRDAREDQIAATRYVPREMIGVEDLDGNGVWRVMPGYGPVWQPTAIPVGWAPYRYGHWAWVEPWGWTWIDDAPWGFAPFHYGRWAFLGGAWVWVPGRIVTRPVYAPALVVFAGGGTTVVAGGGVAWFPLGPREPYIPPYTVSNVYVRNVNISQVTVVNSRAVNVNTIRYVNRSVPGAWTAVPNQAFVRAQPVPGAAVVVTNTEIMRAPIHGGYAPVAPVPQSVLGRPMPGPVARPPALIMSRPVVVRQAPPPAPVPFAVRQRALEARPGRPLSPDELSNLRRNSPGPNPPAVIMSPRPRGGPVGPGPQPGRIQGGPGQPMSPQGPRPGQPVQRGPVYQGQPERGPVMQPRGSQPGQPGPRQQPGIRPGQGPEMRQPQGQQRGPEMRQPQGQQQGPEMRQPQGQQRGPEMRQPQGQQQGPEMRQPQGQQRGPEMRQPQGQQQGPEMRQPQGQQRGPEMRQPQGQQRGPEMRQPQPGGPRGRGSSDDELLKKKRPQDQGPSGGGN